MDAVTLQDVARRAGVSVGTVANVVRGYRHVSPAMRERVQAVVDELGYRPHRSARSLATGRSDMIGLAFPDLRRPYFAELAHVFAQVADERGYGLLISETGGTASGEGAVLSNREAGTVDGLIMHPQALTAGALDELRRTTPVVFLGEDPHPAAADQLAIDNVSAADEATTHLVALGRTRIGFLGHEIERLSRTSSLRLEGYRQAIARAGLNADPSLLVSTTVGDARGAEEGMERALDRGFDADALLCRDDLAAIGALRALQRRGRAVPDDVAVIGWDAIGLGASTMPTLTSVAPDTRMLAERALDMLLERLSGYDGPGRHLTIEHRILVRESAPDPGPDYPVGAGPT
ncbi:LacI family DNA-binding transcriptional regulator [Agreia sp.]|uniref:LacI family DNA-binding transcriptional regulator n=1 Tax=Agreia sp. TaxID=1872416 RepID=UPI0035BC1090